MAVTCTEKVDSRERSGGTETRRWQVRGTASEATVLSTLLSTTPTSANGLLRDPEVSYEAVWADTANGDGLWECSVRYVQPDQQIDVGDVRITWSSGGGTQHITQALEAIAAYDSGGLVSLLTGAGAINFTGEGVEGVDIPVPEFNFTVTKRFASGTLPSLATIYGLTAKTNNAQVTFTDSITGETITLAAGECLFLGGEKVASNDDGSAVLAFAFSASPNKTNLAVGPITVAAKKGWEYLSVEYRDEVDTGRDAVVKQPSIAQVLRVFEAGAFSGLGL